MMIDARSEPHERVQSIELSSYYVNMHLGPSVAHLLLLWLFTHSGQNQFLLGEIKNPTVRSVERGQQVGRLSCIWFIQILYPAPHMVPKAPPGVIPEHC